MGGPRFAALPSPCLVDEALRIRVEGLVPGSTVMLRLAGTLPPDQAMLSQARFVVQGEDLDLTRDAPVAGSYSGVDAMGLFWSRQAVPTGQVPAWIPLDADWLVLTLAAEVEGTPTRLVQPVHRSFASGVGSRDLREAGLVGRFFVPEAGGPHPAVLVVGGSGGRMDWSAEAASLLASHGFAALALAYFGMDGLPPTLERIPLEYFGAALDWLAAQPEVAPGRIAACGMSRGGELALLLGATFPAIRAVVAFAGSGAVHPAYPPSGRSAWTWRGRELPCSDTNAPVLHAIEVERIQGPVMCIVGEADALWPAAKLTGVALRRLRDMGFPHRVELLSYPDAGHFLGWPHVATTMTRFRHPVSGQELDRGGSPEGTARARQDAWPRMLAFLHDSLAP